MPSCDSEVYPDWRQADQPSGATSSELSGETRNAPPYERKGVDSQ
jgi:hypothetical protein